MRLEDGHLPGTQPRRSRALFLLIVVAAAILIGVAIYALAERPEASRSIPSRSPPGAATGDRQRVL